MVNSELENAVKERKYTRSKVTRIYNIASNNIDSLNELRKSEYLTSLNELRNELRDIDKRVFQLSPETTDMDVLLEEEESYNYKITLALALLQPSPVNNNNDVSTNSTSFHPMTTKLRLPTIDLPTFSNDKNESLEQFFHALESILIKHGLSEYEKFVYLKSQVKKGPSALLNSLEPGEQSYTVAKKLLSDAFASPLTQRYDVLKRLCHLKLSPSNDVYEFIGEVRSVTSSIKLLNVDVDTVIQFFVWHAMNDKFQNQLIQITNNSKPSLDEIMTNIFSAAERYLKLTDRIVENKPRSNFYVESRRKESPVKTNNLAVEVKYKNYKYCPLCTADNKKVSHVLRECNSYVTPGEKVKKLESLNYCGKCSFINHKTVNCRFKFSSPCRSCNGNQLTCLCTSKCVNDSTKSANSYSSTVHFKSAVGADNIILPTFSLSIIGNPEKATCRVLNDTGSQRNFISEKFAQKLDLSVVRSDIDLVIFGFNSDKRVKTNIVEVNVLICGETYKIDAIIVPSINISLNIPNINNVASEFRERGYELADKTLYDSLNTDIDLIMGPDAVRLLCPETVSFGNVPDRAVYLSTKVGIMLLGDINHNLSCIRSLPNIQSNNSVVRGQIADIEFSSDSNSVYANTATVIDVCDENGNIDLMKLNIATDRALNEQSSYFMNYDNVASEPESNEINDEVVNYVLSNTERSEEGRLIMPLPWSSDCKHLLGTNFNLSKNILFSNLKKMKDCDKILMYDKVFQEQEELGIIERIDDVDDFITSHPECSFLPHMGIFRMNKETTKCRVVYLSNLCERSKTKPNSVSHNNALLPGPCLNNKMTTALILSRFDKFILIFDIQKAFLNIELRECDQNRLLFLWFRNVVDGDYRIVAYKNLRLSFGLRPSPAILMLALYKILVVDVENDDYELLKLKTLIYANIYMDNGLVSSNDEREMDSFYNQLPVVFRNYKFELQQFVTNLDSLQSRIDNEYDKPCDEIIKLFGMLWNRKDDTIGPNQINLNSTANTKRSILSSLNAVYDIFNYYGPIMNRAKLFFHKLQCDKGLDWDTVLSSELVNEWKRICCEANKTPIISHQRFFGPRCSDYDLIAFCDASSVSYGVVVYIRDNRSRRVSFLLAKNKIVNTKLIKKTIPSLECQGVSYAVETLMDIVTELSGVNNILPISISDLYVYTDSMVVISWVKSFFVTHDKMQKRSVFVQNRLKNISDHLRGRNLTLRYIEGRENPADCVSRPTSYKKLQKSNYFQGPQFLREMPSQPDIEVVIPNVAAEDNFTCANVCGSKISTEDSISHLVDPERYSSFARISRVYKYVLLFVSKLKRRSGRGDPTFENPVAVGVNHLIRVEQRIHFGSIYSFFKSRTIPVSKIPDLVLQMNLFLDDNEIIRVKSKFASGPYPILLTNDSRITMLIIRDFHERFSHAGVYTVTREIRREFWILRAFATVRKTLKSCITCKRVNEKPLKLNQNSYREFRSNPPKVPFSSVFLDYIGPINVRIENNVKKVWLLIVTCLFSRAISLKICFSAETREFLRVLQLHIYEYGMFQFCLSDLGSQIVAGTKIISDFFEDPACVEFFQSHGIDKVSFEQYPKGNSTLGGLVENCVKQVKNLIRKSIGKLILNYPDFQLIVSKTCHIVNRRPVAFHESLRDSNPNECLEPITPEMLIYGRELVSVNVIPQIQYELPDEADDLVSIRDEYSKIKIANKRLVDSYSSEFLVKLISQAIDKKDRYKPVAHKNLDIGDIVLLIEPNTKRSNYPLGVVRKINLNSIGEVVSATVMKGKNRETVFRHASSLILLLQPDAFVDETNDEPELQVVEQQLSPRPTRKSSKKARELIRRQLDDGSD